LWLAQRVSAPWMTGAALGLASCFAARRCLPSRNRRPRSRNKALFARPCTAARFVAGAARAQRLPGVADRVLPIGTGAASNYGQQSPRLARVGIDSGHWRMVPERTRLSVGCLGGGYLADCLNRTICVPGYGVLLALCGSRWRYVAHPERLCDFHARLRRHQRKCLLPSRGDARSHRPGRGGHQI